MTRRHETRSGGLHLLFRHREGVRNSAGKVAPGIDVRGEGGFIVWWPAAGCPVLAEGPPAEWPAWLLADLRPPPGPRVAPALPVSVENAGAARRYAVGALRRAVAEVASSREGTRNTTFNRATFAMMRFVAAGALTTAEVADAMAAAAVVAGLDVREIAATLASALRAGGAA